MKDELIKDLTELRDLSIDAKAKMTLLNDKAEKFHKKYTENEIIQAMREDNYSYSEIASVVGKSISSVYFKYKNMKAGEVDE